MPTDKRTKFSEEAVVAAVRRLREKHGACSYGMIADELGANKTGMRLRIRRLVNAGWLEVNEEIAGSIRLGPKAPRPTLDVAVRLYFDGIGRPIDAELITEKH